MAGFAVRILTVVGWCRVSLGGIFIVASLLLERKRWG